MLADQFHGAAIAARNTRAVDETARLLWRAHAEGQILDAEATAVAEALQARRASFAVRLDRHSSRPAHDLRRAARRPRSPDRQASIERRRRQAMSGIVPAKIAASFTMGEIAVLTVVARQCQRAGACTLPTDAIAALAGVCRRTVQNALSHARLIGLILVRERRVPGRPSGTNVIRIASPEWSTWLRLGGGGCKAVRPTNNESSIREAKRKDCAPPSSATSGAIRPADARFARFPPAGPQSTA
jgi:hypothetical protein